MSRGPLHIRRGLTIPTHELEYTARRGSGPGGQHANKSNTAVTLRWSVRESAALSPWQRSRLLERLSLTADGVLVIRTDSHRSQLANKEEAAERLVALVQDALRTERRRIATKPTRASQRRRVDKKKQRGAVKRGRGRYRGDD